MFKEMGYKKKVHVNYETEKITLIGYTKNINFEIEDCPIVFIIPQKMITTNIIINMQELQAINKKCEELGWYE